MVVIVGIVEVAIVEVDEVAASALTVAMREEVVSLVAINVAGTRDEVVASVAGAVVSKMTLMIAEGEDSAAAVGYG